MHGELWTGISSDHRSMIRCTTSRLRCFLVLKDKFHYSDTCWWVARTQAGRWTNTFLWAVSEKTFFTFIVFGLTWLCSALNAPLCWWMCVLGIWGESTGKMGFCGWWMFTFCRLSWCGGLFVWNCVRWCASYQLWTLLCQLFHCFLRPYWLEIPVVLNRGSSCVERVHAVWFGKFSNLKSCSSSFRQVMVRYASTWMEVHVPAVRLTGSTLCMMALVFSVLSDTYVWLNTPRTGPAEKAICKLK